MRACVSADLVPRRGQIGAGLVEPADEFGTFSRVLVLVQGANSVPLFAPPNCPRQVPPHRLVATCRVERSAGRSAHLTLHLLKQPPLGSVGQLLRPALPSPRRQERDSKGGALTTLVGEGGGAEKSGIGDTRLLSHFETTPRAPHLSWV